MQKHCNYCGRDNAEFDSAFDERCRWCQDESDSFPISPVLPMPDFGGNGFDPGGSGSTGGDVGGGFGGFGGGDFGGGGAGGDF